MESSQAEHQDKREDHKEHGTVEPQPIRRLQESLINRIAAGEIIHRPASALKELLENSLDAGATSIRVVVKDGGLKLLQIVDNGCGIRKTDLPILAERFTTSKLSTFSDLQKIRTYGFRGEALASISHVAHLSIITKTRTDSCAWKACYVDGALAPTKPGQTPDPKASAGNDGTTITVEDLFYNTPTRLAALRSSSEEYSRILDVVTRYSVHNPTVAFVCKKASSPSPDLSTSSNSTTKQAIRMLYGQSIARNLLSASFPSESSTATGTAKTGSGNPGDAMDVDTHEIMEGDVKWKGEAHFTNANYHGKKMVFLLFINHRLVESPRIKRALENAYTSILPKGSAPFICLSLEIDPSSVDVNVHPTKREVHFLDEEAITECAADTIHRALAEQGHSRTFEYQTQTLLTGGILDTSRKEKGKGKERANTRDVAEPGGDEDGSVIPVGVSAKERQVVSKNKVRVNLEDRTLDSMFPVLDPTTQSHVSREERPLQGLEQDKVRSKEELDSIAIQTAAVTSRMKAREIPESECYLTSVHNLRKAVVKAKHNYLTDVVQKHVFVGVIDLHRSLSLIQHSTKLFLVSHAALAEELFYQLGLRQFGNFPRLRLEPPPSIRHLVRLAVRAEDERWKACGVQLEQEEVVDCIISRITKNATMLEQYFSFGVTYRHSDRSAEHAEGDEGREEREQELLLESLPLLLRGYTPDLSRLPLFLMRLGPQVRWAEERPCFESFLRELAYFYRPGPGIDSELSSSARQSDNDKDEDEDEIEREREKKDKEKAERWQIEHVLFPCIRKYLVAPKTLLDRDVVQVASLPDLYRVFERC